MSTALAEVVNRTHERGGKIVIPSFALERAQETLYARPSIIISASGMCEAGRVLHHLRTTIGDSKNTVLIVGFQEPRMLGWRLVEGRHEVRIFGLPHTRLAEVVALDGFSAHADQAGLLAFVEGVRAPGSLRGIVLVHAEPPAQKVLSALLAERGFPTAHIPAPGGKTRFQWSSTEDR